MRSSFSLKVSCFAIITYPEKSELKSEKLISSFLFLFATSVTNILSSIGAEFTSSALPSLLNAIKGKKSSDNFFSFILPKLALSPKFESALTASFGPMCV